jgi:hypothetical protein
MMIKWLLEKYSMRSSKSILRKSPWMEDVLTFLHKVFNDPAPAMRTTMRIISSMPVKRSARRLPERLFGTFPKSG